MQNQTTEQVGTQFVPNIRHNSWFRYICTAKIYFNSADDDVVCKPTCRGEKKVEIKRESLNFIGPFTSSASPGVWDRDHDQNKSNPVCKGGSLHLNSCC